jgi:catechol 2,3-dioxygenase-like lactoylglutathione lyase family enzyme
VLAVFDHVTLRISDRAASERFYDLVLETLGVQRDGTGDEFTEWAEFSVAQATDAQPVTRRLHLGFAAPSCAHVDEFWRTGTEADHRSDGEPGPRTEYREDYYGAFLLDPDGNSVEAVHHGGISGDGAIDHLWIRVADVAVATRFYEAVAPFGGFRLRGDDPGCDQFVGDGGSFTLVPGEPTADVHIAFPSTDDATVDAFHRTLVEAGYRDNGGPGERPQYHPGYYGAFFLDPDGNNVEVVNHNRSSS